MPNNAKNRSAFIAIVGRPNVGKSSLLNKILGQKVSIVSSKPQTTRTRIMGVLTEQETQLVFLDTPGIHRPKDNLGKYMVRAAKESILGVDACMLVVEAGREIFDEELNLIAAFAKEKLPVVLAINKIDLLGDKSELFGQIAKFSQKFDFAGVVPVSARTGDGVTHLVSELKKLSVESEHCFDSDTLTDQPERVLAAEIIREKFLRSLDKELPYGIAVSIEKMRQRPSNCEITDIDATIYCEKENHKRIMIGKNGAMLKKVGSEARHDMEKFFCCKINLQLWIKVKENWRNHEALLKNLGYDSDDL